MNGQKMYKTGKQNEQSGIAFWFKIYKVLSHSYSNNLCSVKIRNLKDEAKDDSDESGIED